jgi:hypothetical protein
MGLLHVNATGMSHACAEKFQAALSLAPDEKSVEEMQALWEEVQQHIGLGFFLASMTTGASKLFALGTLYASVLGRVELW